jgi:hypothetical protein
MCAQESFANRHTIKILSAFAVGAAAAKTMNTTETSLENRVLALETRVLALEALAAAQPEKTKRANSFVQDASESHLNFRIELLSFIEDHIEVLKLVHNIVGPTDRGKNKLILTYIRRAESKLDKFQARFAWLEETRKNIEKGAPQNPPPAPAKSRGASLLKSPALNRLLRSVSLWNM